MGKHSGARHSRSPERKKATKTLLWVAAVIVAAAMALFWQLREKDAFRPAETEIAAGTVETVEQQALEEEETLPPEELPGDAPGGETGPEEEFQSGFVEDVEEEQITGGSFAPELEILPEDSGLTPEQYEAMVQQAGEEPEHPAYTPWLTPGREEERYVYLQHSDVGMAAAEYIVRSGVIVASAEVAYMDVTGLDDASAAMVAEGFTAVLPPEAAQAGAELLWERQGDWLVLATLLKGLDDPAKLAFFGDCGLMRIVDEETYTIDAAEEFLLELGYIKEE